MEAPRISPVLSGFVVILARPAGVDDGAGEVVAPR